MFERKWLDDGFMKGFLFCALSGMALKVGNEWKEHGWWIKVDATQKPVRVVIDDGRGSKPVV
jgi:hypothetical protein